MVGSLLGLFIFFYANGSWPEPAEQVSFTANLRDQKDQKLVGLSHFLPRKPPALYEKCAYQGDRHFSLCLRKNPVIGTYTHCICVIKPGTQLASQN